MKNNNESNIKSLFNPKSVVVIGASHDQTKIGFKVMDNIVYGGYQGAVYPVNTKGGSILGYPVYKSIKEIPQNNIDVALIVIPAKAVFAAVKECALKNIKYLVIITSGFSEIGNDKEEKEITEFALAHQMRILGPNMFGIYSKSVKLNATFGPKNIKEGNVAILTQSGAIGIGMIGKTAALNLGLSAIISIGNKADLEETELIEYLIHDHETKIIMIYMEGVKNGAQFVKILKKASKTKPVIVVKSGRSKRGAMATASHTGSLAGEDAVFNDIMTQCGVLRAESIKEGLDWAKFLAESPLPKGENSIIITNGGGLGVLATDAAEKYKIDLYDDQAQLTETYSKVISSFGSTKNPIDLTGGATGPDYDHVFEASLTNEKIHSLIGLYCETAVFAGNELPKVIESKFKRAKEVGKPVIFSFFGGSQVEKYTKQLQDRNIPVYGDVYEAVSCMGALYQYMRNVKEIEEPHESNPNKGIEKINKLVSQVQKQKRKFLLAHEAQEVMKYAEIPIPKSIVAHSEEEAIKATKEIGYPIVMKIVSKDIIHKSEAGGVMVGLNNEEEIKSSYKKIMSNAKKYKADAKIEGIEVTEMVKKGLETIIGARQDASFGPIVMFGLGGIYVEVLKDVQFRAVPLSKKSAEKMIMSIKAKALLTGVRNEPAKDKSALVDILLKIGQIIQNCPDITDIEINPVMAYAKGATAVDVRILIK